MQRPARRGSPGWSRLARGGRVEPSAVVRQAITEGDLNEALRQAGVEQAAETRLITLEPSGKITVLKAL